MSASSVRPKAGPSLLPAHPTLTSVWCRMGWKELRQNTPLLGIFFAGLLTSLAISTLAGQLFQVAPSDIADFWFGTIYVFIPVFSLAIGVFIFAPEKENRTSQFLGILPMRSGQIVFIKLVIGLLTVAIFIFLGVLLQRFGQIFVGESSTATIANETAAFERSLTPSSLFGQWQWQATPVVSCITLTMECYCWGAICSLVCKRAIFAAVLAGTCFALASWGFPTAIGAALAQRSTDGPPSRRLFSDSFYTIFLISKIATYAAMGLGLAHLGSRWLGHSPNNEFPDWLGRVAAKPRERIESSGDTSWGVSADRPFINSRIYSSLIWQSVRQFGTTFFFTLLGAAPFLFGSVLIAATVSEFQIDHLFVYSCLAVVLVVIPLIASMFVFIVDHQDRNYRFFQQHREFGRKLWLARLLPAALVTLVCGLLLSMGLVVLGWQLLTASETALVFRFALFPAIVVFCAFAIGQFNSMFLRSGVFVVVSVIVMSGILFAGICGLCFLDPTLVAFLLPVPLAMLAITWWRAPHLLAESNPMANLVLPWLSLGIVVVVSVTALSWFRVASVPQTDFSLEKHLSSYVALDESRNQRDAQVNPIFERAILLRDAANEMVATEAVGEAYNLRLFTWPTPDYARSFDIENPAPLRQFVSRNQDSLKLLALANEQPATSPPVLDPRSRSRRVEQIARISLLISAQATLAQWDGDLERALGYWLQLKRFTEQYDVESTNALLGLLRWSEFPGQSPEFIKQAIKAATITPDQWCTQTEYLTQSRRLDLANWYEGLISGQSVLDPPLGIQFNYGARENKKQSFLLIPWELERSKRWTFLTLEELSFQRSQRRGLILEGSMPDHVLNLDSSLYDTYQAAAVSVHYPNHRDYDEFFSIRDNERWGDFIYMLRQIQTYHYVRVRMALNGWKLEYGQYPDQLAALVPDYFESLPLDVLYGIEFAYSPTGLDNKVCVSGSGWKSRRGPDQQEWEVIKLVYESMIDSGHPFLLPWSMARKPTLASCNVMDEPNIETFKCYDYSGPGLSTVGHNLQDYELPSIDSNDD